MHALEKYSAALSPAQSQVMEALHREITDLPGLVMKERYKLPFYFGRSWICYLNPLKNGGVELAFTRGNELSNVHGILEHGNRKQIAGVTCRQLKDVPFNLIRDTLYEAWELDREKPYRHPGKRKER